MRIREWMIRFMRGRYGADQLSRCLLWAVLGCMLVSMFTKGALKSIFYWASIFFLVYCYFRIFSRNYSKRYAENQRFLTQTAGIRRFFSRQKSLVRQRRTHHIYSCPSCRQKIRIPRGRGKVEISCPKCQARFIKRS